MKIAIISDSHTYHNAIEIPDVDFLVHCGDNTIYGEIWEMIEFLEWFGKQKPKNKIFINGNHEVQVSKLGNLTKIMVEEHNKAEGTDIHYLEETGIELEGIKFWGSPYTPEFFSWAYNYKRSDGQRRWVGIPADTDVLITHGPAYGIMDGVQPHPQYQDEHAGCAALLEKVKEIKPKLHCFGHIHSHYGHKRLANPALSETLFVNAATCDSAYKPTRKPVIVDTDTWEVVDEGRAELIDYKGYKVPIIQFNDTETDS